MEELLLGYLTPASLGLDSNRFPEFRPQQLEAMERVLYDDARFVGLCLPTGTGKSLAAVAMALQSGKRTVILTHTKALMDQYKADFPQLVEIKGKSNYECDHIGADSCADGVDAGCPWAGKAGGWCTYEQQKSMAKKAQVVITNYAYWLTVNERGQGLDRNEVDDEGEVTGNVEMLVMDEAHASPEILGDYIGFRLYEKEVSKYTEIMTIGDSLTSWVNLAERIWQDVEQDTKTLKLEITFLRSRGEWSKVKKLMEQVKRNKELEDKLYRLSTAKPDEWVCEFSEGTRYGRVWDFDIIWPGRCAEQYLFTGIPKVVLMSATLRPKTFAQNGVSKDQYVFHEWPRIFPANRAPVYYYPALDDESKAIKITRGTRDHDLELWVHHIDELLSQRLDRRSLVITTSYNYQRYLMEHSRYAKYMVGNTADSDSLTARETFEKFIETPAPVVLCSPSFGTGWDFKGPRCEFLVISKIPFRPPPSASKLMAARMKQDPEYGGALVMQDLAQYSGRIMRSMDDRGEVVIVDGSWNQVAVRYQHLAPRGWVKGVRRVNQLPERPPKLS